MGIIVKFRDLYLSKQVELGRRISIQELHRETGVAWSTLDRWKNGDLKGLELSTLSALCTYFNCSVGDLLEYVSDDEGDSNG